MYSGKCAVCCMPWTETLLASRNDFCPANGHWIHYKCQGLNKNSLVSVCPFCKRLGAGYVKTRSVRDIKEVENAQKSTNATKPVYVCQQTQTDHPCSVSRSIQTSPTQWRESRRLIRQPETYVQLDTAQIRAREIGLQLLHAKLTATSFSQKDDKAPSSPISLRENSPTPEYKLLPSPPITSFNNTPSSSTVPESTQPNAGVCFTTTEIYCAAKSFVEFRFDENVRSSSTLTTEQKEDYPNIRKSFAKSDYGHFVSSDVSAYGIDESAKKLLPTELQQIFVPIDTPRDGNCLYNALSFCMLKTFDANFLLRRLQLAELCTNYERYQEIFRNMNLEDKFVLLMKQSASFHKWGNSDALQVLSRVLTRKIYVYRVSHEKCFWDCFDLEPEDSSKFLPLYLMNQENQHYVSLVPNTHVPSNTIHDTRCWLTFKSGYIPAAMKPNDQYHGLVIDLSDSQTERLETASPNSTRINVDNMGPSTYTGLEAGKWDPEIAAKLHLDENRRKISTNDAIYLNILRDEMITAAQGPWSQNIPIYSKRTSHGMFWRNKVADLFPKYSKQNQAKKVIAMKNYCTDERNYALIRAALIALGVPLLAANNYSLANRKIHIDSYYDGTDDKSKVNLPEYVKDLREHCEPDQSNADNTNEPGAQNTENITTTPIEPEATTEAPIRTEFETQIRDLATALGIGDEVLNYVPPKAFKFIIPHSELHLLFDFKLDKFCAKSYPIVVDKYLNLEQKCCAYKSHHVPYICKNESAYATFRGSCGCGIEFTISVTEKPTLGKDTVCLAKSTGEFVLIQEKPVGRPLKGYARDNAAKEMKHVKPSKVHLERLRSTNKYRALHNNYPQLSSSVLKLIAAEVRNGGNMKTNVFHDINQFNQELIINRPRKFVKGFVQKLDQTPDHVNILMYTQDTLDLLRFLQKKEEVVLHLDATGSVVTQKGITAKKCLLYLFLVKSKQFSFPLAEAISQRGTTIEISEMIRRLKYDTKQIHPTAKRMIGIAVCDFSFALIHGLMEGLNSMTLEDYLNYSFRLLRTDKSFNPERSVVFICTAHLIHAFSRLLAKHVPKELHFIAKCSLAKLQESQDLETFSATTRLISKFFDSEFLEHHQVTRLYELITAHSFDFETYDITELVEYLAEETEFAEHTTLRSKSPYYHLFKNERAQSLASAGTASTINPYFCPNITQLIQDQYAPYTPLFATMLLKRSKRHEECRLTNANIESEFNIIKNILHADGKEPINVFVREDFAYHDGKVAKVFETAMMGNKKPQKRGPKHLRDKANSHTIDSKNMRLVPDSSKASVNVPTLKIPVQAKKCFRTSTFTAREQWFRKQKRFTSPRYFSDDKKLSAARFKATCSEKRQDGTERTSTVLNDSQIPHGIVNLGRICYLNSLLQALFATSAVRQDVMDTMLKEFYLMLYDSPNPPESGDIKTILQSWNEKLSMKLPVDEEQDCHEVFMEMVTKKEFGIEDLFYFMKERTVSCSCGASTSDYENSYYHMIRPEDNIIPCLEFAKVVREEVTADCDLCGAKVKNIEEQFITSPQILLVMDRLFAQTQTGKVAKNLRRKHVDMNVTLPTGIGNREYKLVSVIVHSGATIRSGHYVAYSYIDGSWIRYDDRTITRLKAEPIFTTEDIYLTFYEKTG